MCCFWGVVFNCCTLSCQFSAAAAVILPHTNIATSVTECGLGSVSAETLQRSDTNYSWASTKDRLSFWVPVNTHCDDTLSPTLSFQGCECIFKYLSIKPQNISLRYCKLGDKRINLPNTDTYLVQKLNGTSHLFNNAHLNLEWWTTATNEEIKSCTEAPSGSFSSSLIQSLYVYGGLCTHTFWYIYYKHAYVYIYITIIWYMFAPHGRYFYVLYNEWSTQVFECGIIDEISWGCLITRENVARRWQTILFMEKDAKFWF